MSLQIRPDYLAFGRPDFTEAEIEAIARVMRSGWIGQGNETQSFEKELAAEVGANQVVTVNSCTSALFLALRALDVGPGDEVIVPSLTWCSTANVALYLGATPVFADVDASTLCVTAESVAAVLSPKTRAVIPVHMGGLCADVDAISRALPERVSVIEDAAHAFGSRYLTGGKVGSSGNMACFSFYANKNLSTAEGGAIATNNIELASKISSLRLHALPADAWRRFTNPGVTFDGGIAHLGYKMNYTDLQAAIGRVQLSRFRELQERRLQIAQTYCRRLADSGLVRFQDQILDEKHARHLFVVTFEEGVVRREGLSRDEILRAMRAANIGVSVHYHPLHTMPLYREKRVQTLAVTEDIARRILTLPIGSNMSPADAEYVCDHFLSIVSS